MAGEELRVMGKRLDLGAYQFIEIEPVDLGEQYTDSGRRPNTIILRLTTPMDETFVNRSVRVLLSEQAQQDIIDTLNENLTTKREETS